jgi:hypothetical protein
MNRYLGSEFPQILAKDNVEYQQANLTVTGLFIPLTLSFGGTHFTASDCFVLL